MTVIEPLHAEILQEAGNVYSRSWTKVSVSTAPPELLAEYTPEKRRSSFGKRLLRQAGCGCSKKRTLSGECWR